jgi:hypothetical protein
MRHISFALCWYLHVIVLGLIGGLFQQALTLSEALQTKKTVESVQTARIAGLEALVKSS